MVHAAAGANGVLLERAQQRRRLARVEDRDASGRRIDELARQRRDAGQPLQKLSAVRSAVSSAAACPRISATSVPGSHSVPSA